MKIIISFFIILTSLKVHSSLPGDEYGELVLGEIQKTFIKSYGVSDKYWNKTEKIKPLVNKVVDSKRGKKPIENNLIIDEDNSWSKYKNRQKVELIDNDEYVKYVSKDKETKKLINEQKTKPSHDWMTNKLNEQSNWNKSKKAQLKNWENDKKETLNYWYSEKKKFLRRIPIYKENLVSKNVFSSAGSFKPNNEKLKAKFKGAGVVVVPNAFDQRVKDQGERPTCTAFAATRALEIALAQSGKSKRLSDQYIYYASKPRCQQSPCSTKGSWAFSAFEESQASKTPDIPTQNSCPYSKNPKVGNETQIPLKNGCFNGEHKLSKFSQVKNLNQIMKSLDRGSPVVSGFKLSPNFYKNKGVVLFKDANKSNKMDSHAAGHAILLIGYMKIPSSLNEGKVCLLTANSWGSGWGKGGHTCLSEKWVKNFRFNIPFLAVEKVI